MQSLQDGVTGSPVTASGRFFQAMLFTAAIIAGVAGGIQIADLLDAGLPPIETQSPTPSYSSAAVRIIGGSFAAAGFALACYAEVRAIIVSALTSFFGGFTYYAVLLPFGSGRLFATAICAVMVGLAGGLLARRFLIAPLITAVAGVTPFLPGSGVYRGMYALLNDQTVLGLNNIFVAIGTCLALAGGVVLGEWFARRIRRPQSFNPYRAFRVAGRVTFQQIRRAEQAASRRRAEQAAKGHVKREAKKEEHARKKTGSTKVGVTAHSSQSQSQSQSQAQSSPTANVKPHTQSASQPASLPERPASSDSVE